MDLDRDDVSNPGGGFRMRQPSAKDAFLTAPERSTETPARAQSPALQTLDLTRRYGALTALDRMNLTIRTGAIFGLLGPNGAGKSTAIKMLTTILPPSSGTALIAGFDICKQPRDVRRHLGYIPQAVSAENILTGGENMQLFAKLYDVPSKVRRERIEEALALVSLTEFSKTQVKRYSGGMIRRLEIAIALVHRPPVLVLDEPTVGLDPAARFAIWDRLHSLRQQNGMTILITTHQMHEAEELCDEVAILNKGQIVACGPISALKAQIGPEASLDDVFIAHTGSTIEEGGFSDAFRSRRTAKRLD
jgi:ABC-2 type transport system ATP-binding protein